MKAPGFSEAEQLEARDKLRERLIVLPEAKSPKRGWVRAAVAIGVILALVIGGAVGYAFQRKQVRIARADTAAVQRDLDTQRARAAAATTGANTQITDLKTQVNDLTDALAIANDAKDLATVGTTSANSRISKLTAKVAQLTALTGPRLHHGWHIGFVRMVSASTSPDRIVIDLGRWFTGPDARKAAIADGFITQGENLPNPRYLRNPTHDFRIVDVTSTTQVTLRHYRGATSPTSVSMTQLESIFGSRRSADETVRLDPFWIHVTDGQVDGMRQQQYP